MNRKIKKKYENVYKNETWIGRYMIHTLLKTIVGNDVPAAHEKG